MKGACDTANCTDFLSGDGTIDLSVTQGTTNYLALHLRTGGGGTIS